MSAFSNNSRVHQLLADPRLRMMVVNKAWLRGRISITKNIETFHARDNDIREILMEEGSRLIYIDVSRNEELYYVNYLNCHALRYINLSDTCVDAFHITKSMRKVILARSELESITFDSDVSSLEELDVSECRLVHLNLESISFIEFLDCHDNALSILSLPKSVRWLNARHTQISELRHPDAQVVDASHCLRLKHVWLPRTQRVDLLFSFIEDIHVPQVEHLSLSTEHLVLEKSFISFSTLEYLFVISTNDYERLPFFPYANNDSMDYRRYYAHHDQVRQALHHELFWHPTFLFFLETYRIHSNFLITCKQCHRAKEYSHFGSRCICSTCYSRSSSSAKATSKSRSTSISSLDSDSDTG